MNKKKIFALIFAVVMAMSLMAGTAFAADIHIDGSGAEYKAYRLLDLTTSLKVDHEYHEGPHTDSCYNYAYTVNPKYREMLQVQLNVAGTMGSYYADRDNDGTISDDEILIAFDFMRTDAHMLRKFADNMLWAIEDIGRDADATSWRNDNGCFFSDVEQGYYLIAESRRAADPDSVSLVMLDTAGQDNLTITSKEGVPTLTKKIVLADGSLVDADTVAKGDTVKYRLTITMPSNLEDYYGAYPLIVHDDIQGALTLEEDSITAWIGDKDAPFGEQVAFEKLDMSNQIVRDGCDMELFFEDIRAVKEGVSADSVLTIGYTCTVGDDVVLSAEGNANVAKLEFPADPYHSNVTSITMGDKTNVFSFGVKVSKVDDHQRPLHGADFKLQMADAKGNYNDLMTSDVDAGADGTEFTFLGLDVGKYRLIETHAPDGYVEADPVDFEITATYDLVSDDPAISAILVKNGDDVLSEGERALFTVDVATGMVNTKVINIAGKRMPTTGGTGLAMLYAGGGILLAAGCAVFVLKKRAGKAASKAE